MRGIVLDCVIRNLYRLPGPTVNTSSLVIMDLTILNLDFIIFITVTANRNPVRTIVVYLQIRKPDAFTIQDLQAATAVAGDGGVLNAEVGTGTGRIDAQRAPVHNLAVVDERPTVQHHHLGG